MNQSEGTHRNGKRHYFCEFLELGSVDDTYDLPVQSDWTQTEICNEIWVLLLYMYTIRYSRDNI